MMDRRRVAARAPDAMWPGWTSALNLAAARYGTVLHDRRPLLPRAAHQSHLRGSATSGGRHPSRAAICRADSEAASPGARKDARVEPRRQRTATDVHAV